MLITMKPANFDWGVVGAVVICMMEIFQLFVFTEVKDSQQQKLNKTLIHTEGDLESDI